jgi:2-amino-4-ketopentanoate thiolase alpha subunit
MDARKGDWVEISGVVLKPEERAPQVPDDTRKTPLILWVKGYAQHPANIGDAVEIETVTSRKIKGVLTAVEPPCTHSYGEYVPELAKVREQVKELLFGGKQE